MFIGNKSLLLIGNRCLLKISAYSLLEMSRVRAERKSKRLPTRI
jgi:hypothetical protein